MIVNIINELLSLGEKLIPDKESSLAFERKMQELSKQITKENKTLLHRVIPLTFPISVWVFLFLPFLAYMTSLVKYWKTGVFYEIPLPKEFLEQLFQIVLIFICGLVGKWNIKEFYRGKK